MRNRIEAIHFQRAAHCQVFVLQSPMFFFGHPRIMSFLLCNPHLAGFGGIWPMVSLLQSADPGSLISCV
ncbi:MAG: hypothetical protein NWQ37_17420 [Marivita lacus]|nr:hypothetical protein [Marivita lacus]